MNTLILNGSPRIDGDTSFLVSRFLGELQGEAAELRAFSPAFNIAPCNDCRACRKTKGCVIRDDMQVIYDDDFDNILIASPVYNGNLTPPLVTLATRLQAYYTAERFLKDKFNLRPKRAGLVLVGGGDGKPAAASKLAKFIFRQLNAEFLERNAAFSLNTDEIPAKHDETAIAQVLGIAKYFND